MYHWLIQYALVSITKGILIWDWTEDFKYLWYFPECGRPGLDLWVRKIPLEKEMATHFSILAWRIPWMEEPGRLQSTGSQRVRHGWATSLSFTFTFMNREAEKGSPHRGSEKEKLALINYFIIIWTKCLETDVCDVGKLLSFVHPLKMIHALPQKICLSLCQQVSGNKSGEKGHKEKI